jgi:nitroreductase
VVASGIAMMALIMDATELLLTRASNGKLTEPAPDDETLRIALQAAVRAPDHASLQPFRFCLVRGDARARLGQVFAEAQQRRAPNGPVEAVEKARKNPLRAPLLIVVAARLQAHPKVPQVEQLLTAGAAAHAILLALHARGFAGIWRTGDAAYDDSVKAALGLAASDAIIGFLYCGTPNAPTPALKRAAPESVTTEWTEPLA